MAKYTDERKSPRNEKALAVDSEEQIFHSREFPHRCLAGDPCAYPLDQSDHTVASYNSLTPLAFRLHKHSSVSRILLCRQRFDLFLGLGFLRSQFL
ncbi:hypothetical protein ACFX19_034025 [Malus domestica]